MWRSRAGSSQGQEEAEKTQGRLLPFGLHLSLAADLMGGGEVTPFVLNANAKSCEELLYFIG